MKIAIIGCGAIARKRHAPAVAAHPEAELYAVCDPVKENADALAREYGTKAIYDINEILHDPAVNAVIICTPERFHCSNVVAALEAGKDVLCEKPLAMTVDECRKIVETWHKSGRQLMVAFSQRLSPEHQLAKKLLEQGSIGKPIAFRTALAHSGAEYAGMGQPEADFYDKRLAGIGDVMLSVGCHRMDLMAYLFNSRIKAVSALTTTLDKHYADGTPIQAADHAIVNTELENGVAGSVWISWCDYGKMERETVIYGTEGTMFVHGPDEIEVDHRSGETEMYPVEQGTDGWQAITRHFIDVLNEKSNPVCDGIDGLACALALEAVQCSGKEKKRVLTGTL